MINVSETAASKISELLSEENKAGSGLRVFVQGGGCSGFQYGLMIEEKGLYSVEKFLVARRQMYWQVYLHKTVLAAEKRKEQCAAVPGIARR